MVGIPSQSNIRDIIATRTKSEIRFNEKAKRPVEKLIGGVLSTLILVLPEVRRKGINKYTKTKLLDLDLESYVGKNFISL